MRAVLHAFYERTASQGWWLWCLLLEKALHVLACCAAANSACRLPITAAVCLWCVSGEEGMDRKAYRALHAAAWAANITCVLAALCSSNNADAWLYGDVPLQTAPTQVMVSAHLSLSPTPSLHATCASEPAAVAPDGLKQGHVQGTHKHKTHLIICTVHHDTRR
jgi:hypothetical protein